MVTASLGTPPPLLHSFVCMILPGGECRLQTCRGLTAQLFNSTLRTYTILSILSPYAVDGYDKGKQSLVCVMLHDV